MCTEVLKLQDPQILSENKTVVKHELNAVQHTNSTGAHNNI